MRAHFVAQQPADLARIKVGFQLDSTAASGPGCADSPHRDLNLAEQPSTNQTNQKVLHDGLWQHHAAQPGIRMYQGRHPAPGFFWLDFHIDPIAYAGMCCRGWDSAASLIDAQHLAAHPVTANPYR